MLSCKQAANLARQIIEATPENMITQMIHFGGFPRVRQVRGRDDAFYVSWLHEGVEIMVSTVYREVFNDTDDGVWYCVKVADNPDSERHRFIDLRNRETAVLHFWTLVQIHINDMAERKEVTQ